MADDAFVLLALEAFREGELGWLTPKGVVRFRARGFADLPSNALLVKATNQVVEFSRGPFVEVRPISRVEHVM
jgi:hypothetical protein